MVLSSSKNVWLYMTIVFLLLVGLTAAFLLYLRQVMVIAVICMIILSVVSGLWDLFKNALTGFSMNARKVLFGSFLAVAVISLVVFMQYEMSAVFMFASDLISLEKLITDYITTKSGTTSSAMVSFFCDHALTQISSIFKSVSNGIFWSFSRIGLIIIGIIIICPSLFFLWFRKRSQLEKSIASVLPDGYVEDSLETLSDIVCGIRNYVNIHVAEFLITTILFCISLKMAGINQWLLVGLICGLWMLIPYVGPLISTAFVTLFGLTYGTRTGVVMFIVFATIVILDYIYFLRVTDKNKVHPLVIIPLTLIFYELFGIFGMAVCVPIYITFKVVLTEIYEQAVNTFDKPDSCRENTESCKVDAE